MLAVVTGGFGFIGSYVCEQLSQRGWQFIVVDRRTTAAVNQDFVRQLPGLLWDGSPDVSEPDWAEGSGLPESGVDAVFHLAAETHVDRSLGLDPTTLRRTGEDPLDRLYRTNVIGTARVAEYARIAGARLVHWSTDEVYGDAIDGGTYAWDGGGYGPAIPLLRAGLDPRQVCMNASDESSALRPSSPYAASKAAAEMAVHASVRLGLRAAILRPSNAYGPRQARDKLVPVAVDHLAHGRPVPLYDGGWQVRQWVHAADIAAAAMKVIDLQAEGTWNIGGPSLLRNADLVVLLAMQGGSTWAVQVGPDGMVASVADRPGHDGAYCIESRHAKRELGWEPTRSIEKDAAEVFAAYASKV